MSEHIVLVEKSSDWKPGWPKVPVVTAREYVTGEGFGAERRLKVINLCRSFRYLSLGYYCSLLAEARNHKVVPTVRTIQDLSRRSLYSLMTQELDELVQKTLVKSQAAPDTAKYELLICFGQCWEPHLQDLAQQIFESFPAPMLKVDLRLQGNWKIAGVRILPITTLRKSRKEREEDFFLALDGYLSRRWRKPKTKRSARYDLAILHDPEETLPPSDKDAMGRFIKAARDNGIDAELITRKDYGRLAEYDALFIRETTGIAHHTYRFAKKAQNEGLVVIDDPDSILRCTNKVYLAELLQAHRVPVPKTVVLRKKKLDEVEGQIPYPLVLKIPDGSFSRGIFKVEDRKELEKISKKLFKESDLLLAQEYMYTPFDWRVGVIGRKPLYVCKYFMSRDHWQIYNHADKGHPKEGGYETLPVDAAPARVVKTALKAANLIGDGFYGVDLKETDSGVYVIEVNDNPSVDGDVEDAVLQGGLYQRIMDVFLERLERQRQRRARA